MATYAYALKDSVESEGFQGAVAYGDAQSLNVTQLLEEGNGVYVTDDPREQEALDNYGYVKRVSLDEAEQAHKRTRGGGSAKSQAAGDKDKD
jgi:hypothetical protein